MPFDTKKYHAPAERGDVASVALQASIGLDRVRDIIRALAAKADVDISKDLAELQIAADKLEKQFDTLTGWTPSEK